jgi:hypothetical protein
METRSERRGPRGRGGPPAPALCIGESLVDLICERPVSSFDEADAFVPHLRRCGRRCVGTVAAAAARCRGRRPALLAAAPRRGNSGCVRSLDRAAVPEFLIYGDGSRAAMVALAPLVEDAVAAASGIVVVGSNTMVGENERTVTLRAPELALARGSKDEGAASDAPRRAKYVATRTASPASIGRC